MLARLRLLIALTAAVLAAVAVPAQAAQNRPTPQDVGPVAGGGAFVTQTCGQTGSSTGWTFTTTNPAAVTGGTECPPVYGHQPGSPEYYHRTGLWVGDSLDADGGGAFSAAGDRSELTYTAAPGTSITRLRYWRKVFQSADDNWQGYIAVGSRINMIDSCEIAGQPYCQVGADDWYADDPNANLDRYSYRDLDGLSTSSLIVGLTCRDNVNHKCGNGFSIASAEAAIYSAFLTVADASAPAVGSPTGSGWTTDAWSQGTLPLSLNSTDNSVIYATRVYADGSLLTTLQGDCHYDRPRPCTDEPTGTVNIPTANLTDGSHTIAVASVDAAGNETRLTRPTPLKVDNQAPAAPVSLNSPQATSATNNFSASWTLPADAGTPIVAARYQLCQQGSCGAPQAAPSLTGVNGLSLPASGAATLRVWLIDQLGHENAAGAAALTLNYTPPANPQPQPAPGPAPVPAPLPTPGPAPTPTPTVKASPALKITTHRRSGRNVTIAGKTSIKTSGKLTIRYRVRQGGHTHTVTQHATIKHGTFRATFTLSTTIAKARTATVSVAYLGDSDTKSQTRTTTLRLR